MTFIEFMQDRCGKSWVVHRRTARIIAKYGDAVTCLSEKAYAKLRSEWAAAHLPKCPHCGRTYLARSHSGAFTED